MNIPPASHIEIINISDRERRITDPGLFERGGSIILAPKETIKVPLAVYHRICGLPWIMRLERYERLAKAAAEAEAEPASEAVLEAEPKAARRARRKR
jgi:hypothetical protein